MHPDTLAPHPVPPVPMLIQGCPPLETVVSLLTQPGKSVVYKIFKPIQAVEPNDAITGLKTALSGVATPQHVQQPQQQPQ